MAIDLSLDPELDGLRARVEQFVTDVVISLEPRARGERGVEEDLRLELQAAAKAAGIFAPTVATDLGGLGLDWRSTAVVLEAAGYSLIGPLALNAAAPDEGNLHLLASVATVAQRERYLVPLARSARRSR
jgi:acyl-CoA dehydrogenase